MDWLEKITNPYDRKARLYPALLAIAPVLSLITIYYGIDLADNRKLIGILATLGVFYLISSLVRDAGKRLEDSLFDSWGGKPSTQLLRHRNTIIDPATKARYHKFLSKAIQTKFPSAEEEQANAVAADGVYQSAVKWLLENTRDKKKFDILFQENISFGFRRNCFGIRTIAILLASTSVAWLMIVESVITTAGVDLNRLIAADVRVWSPLVISMLTLIVWIFFLSERGVRSAAFIYAGMLLRSCDILSKNK